jgi:hypothetical protein
VTAGPGIGKKIVHVIAAGTGGEAIESGRPDTAARGHFFGFTGRDLVPVISPASGPLGNATCTSNPSTVTVTGTRTECGHRRPQWNPLSQRSSTTLPGSVSLISADTSRP